MFQHLLAPKHAIINGEYRYINKYKFQMRLVFLNVKWQQFLDALASLESTVVSE